jgi:hypothetical protein
MLGAAALGVMSKYLGRFIDELVLQKKVEIPWETVPFPFGWIDVTAAAIITVLGLLLYMFRCRRTRLYGQLEIAAGIFIAFQVLELTIGALSYNMGGIFTALGALYIIVRGCDNVYKTLKADEDATFAWNYIFFGKRVGQKLS